MTPTVKPTQVGGLLPLPEPEIFEGNWETVECYTADQMHAYAQANVQALEARLVALRDAASELVAAVKQSREAEPMSWQSADANKRLVRATGNMTALLESTK